MWNRLRLRLGADKFRSSLEDDVFRFFVSALYKLSSEMVWLPAEAEAQSPSENNLDLLQEPPLSATLPRRRLSGIHLPRTLRSGDLGINKLMSLLNIYRHIYRSPHTAWIITTNHLLSVITSTHAPQHISRPAGRVLDDILVVAPRNLSSTGELKAQVQKCVLDVLTQQVVTEFAMELDASRDSAEGGAGSANTTTTTAGTTAVPLEQAWDDSKTLALQSIGSLFHAYDSMSTKVIQLDSFVKAWGIFVDHVQDTVLLDNRSISPPALRCLEKAVKAVSTAVVDVKDKAAQVWERVRAIADRVGEAMVRGNNAASPTTAAENPHKPFTLESFVAFLDVVRCTRATSRGLDLAEWPLERLTRLMVILKDGPRFARTETIEDDRGGDGGVFDTGQVQVIIRRRPSLARTCRSGRPRRRLLKLVKE